MSTQYTAFISYSHRDSRWAKWVQRAIENYRLPKPLASEMGRSRKLGKVFRDREELSTGQNLGDHLTAALDSSDNLIVICSPNSKASPWVAKEIEYFKALGRGDRIFCLLVEGGAESLAAPLLTDVDGNPLEPLAADPRDEGDGKRLAILKLISGILDTNLDQLAQRERARRQRIFLGYAGLANVFLIAVGAALYFEQERQNEAEQKALERELGIDNIVSMTDFVKRTRQYYDKGALKYVSDEFSKYLVRFDDTDLTTDQRVAKADALRVVGEATYDLGDVEKALQAYSDSRELYYQASRENPVDVDLAIEAAFADFYVGVTHFYEGNLAAAKQPLEHYARQISGLYETNPDHPVLIQESIAAPTTVLTLLVESSEVMSQVLRTQIDTVSAAVDAAIKLSPDNTEVLFLAQSPMDYAAHAHMKSCEVFNALPYREKAVEYAGKAVELDPRNRDYQTNLANALFALADMYLITDEPQKAIAPYLETLELQSDLLADDPQNEYLAGRQLATRLQLLAAKTYYPGIEIQFPRIDEVTRELENADTFELARASRLEALLLGRLTDRALATGDLEAASEYSRKMLNISEKQTETTDHRRSQYRMLYLRQQLALAQLGHRSQSANELKSMLAELPRPDDELNSCQSLDYAWSWSVLNADIEKANAVATKSWALGARGLETAFFAKLLDIPFPNGQ